MEPRRAGIIAEKIWPTGNGFSVVPTGLINQSLLLGSVTLNLSGTSNFYKYLKRDEIAVEWQPLQHKKLVTHR